MRASNDLLYAAARAAGYQVARVCDDGESLLLVGMQKPWDPLTDDGDALRLAVELRISLEMASGHVYAVHADTSAAQYRDTGSGQTMAEVVREAIIACAAEIGGALQPNHESPTNSKPGCTGEDQ